MIFDRDNMFSDAQDLAQVAAAYLSDNSIDLAAAGTIPGLGGSPIHDIGRGTPVRVHCQVTTAFVGATATVTAELVMAADAALTSSLVVLEATAAIPVATLVAGYQFRFGTVPQGISSRYLGMRYTIATATTTAGKITSGLVSVKQSNPSV